MSNDMKLVRKVHFARASALAIEAFTKWQWCVLIDDPCAEDLRRTFETMYAKAKDDQALIKAQGPSTTSEAA